MHEIEPGTAYQKNIEYLPSKISDLPKKNGNLTYTQVNIIPEHK